MGKGAVAECHLIRELVHGIRTFVITHLALSDVSVAAHIHTLPTVE